jgi:hypothetical protein
MTSALGLTVVASPWWPDHLTALRKAIVSDLQERLAFTVLLVDSRFQATRSKSSYLFFSLRDSDVVQFMVL